MSFKEFMRGAMNKPEKGDKVKTFNLKGRVSGYILTKSQKNIPTCGYNYEADVTRLCEELQKLKDECGYPISFNTIMMKALIEGLKVAPHLNAQIKYNATSSCGTIILKEHIDVAMPVILDSGETFPLKVRETENKTLKELSEQINHLVETLKNTDVDRVLFDVITQRTVGLLMSGAFVPTVAQTFTGYVGKHKVAKLSGLLEHAPRDGSSLLMNDLNEGSVCFTNWGMLSNGLTGNVTYTPLLFPQVFLMAMGNIRESDYAFRNEKGEVDIATKKTVPITLMFDHRIGGFKDVMPFIEKLDEIFKNPEIIREW